MSTAYVFVVLASSCMLRACVSVPVAVRLLSRSDMFKPLFKEEYEDFQEKEREAMATGQGVQATW